MTGRGGKRAERCVYFLVWGDAVKIGRTKNLERRITQIRTEFGAHGATLRAAEPECGDMTEKAIHRRFAAYRLHREWFLCRGELAAFVDGLLTPSEKVARALGGPA